MSRFGQYVPKLANVRTECSEPFRSSADCQADNRSFGAVCEMVDVAEVVSVGRVSGLMVMWNVPSLSGRNCRGPCDLGITASCPHVLNLERIFACIACCYRSGYGTFHSGSVPKSIWCCVRTSSGGGFCGLLIRTAISPEISKTGMMIVVRILRLDMV